MTIAEDHLLERKEYGVALLIMNRPEKLNAMSSEMMAAMLEAIPRLSADPGVGAILLTGTGRGFCAGGDMHRAKARNEAATREPPTLEQNIRGRREVMDIARYLHQSPKPTIAMMRGPAAGGGMAIALACDIRIASDTLMMTTAFARVGYSGEHGISYFLNNLVGTAKARELLFTAEKINASKALSLGLINQMVPDAELENQATTYARQIAKGPRSTFEFMKENLNVAMYASLETVMNTEAKNMARCSYTEDHKEAVKAFIEKRPPQFNQGSRNE